MISMRAFLPAFQKLFADLSADIMNTYSADSFDK